MPRYNVDADQGLELSSYCISLYLLTNILDVICVDNLTVAKTPRGEFKMMKQLFFKTLFFCGLVLTHQTAFAQAENLPLLDDNDTILLTVFLKHDQSMNNVQRRDVLEESGFRDMFPPEGVEIVDHYVMMGIGQVIVMRLPPDHLRIVNRAIEHSAWGAYQTEFYITYDLAEARKTQAAAEQSATAQ
jgi:hypothetical protein